MEEVEEVVAMGIVEEVVAMGTVEEVADTVIGMVVETTDMVVGIGSTGRCRLNCLHPVRQARYEQGQPKVSATFPRSSSVQTSGHNAMVIVRFLTATSSELCKGTFNGQVHVDEGQLVLAWHATFSTEASPLVSFSDSTFIRKSCV